MKGTTGIETRRPPCLNYFTRAHKIRACATRAIYYTLDSTRITFLVDFMRLRCETAKGIHVYERKQGRVLFAQGLHIIAASLNSFFKLIYLCLRSALRLTRHSYELLFPD